MPAPQGARDRAVRMYRDRLRSTRNPSWRPPAGAGAPLDIHQATIRNWVEDPERPEGAGPGRAIGEAEDIGTQVEAYRTRSLAEAGPFTSVSADAQALRCHELLIPSIQV